MSFQRTITFSNVKYCSKMDSILFQVLKTQCCVENIHLNVDIRNVIFISSKVENYKQEVPNSAAGVLNILYQEVKIDR